MLKPPPPSALYEAWWSRCITDMTPNPPYVHTHTNTHMHTTHITPPPLKTYTQREKISLPEKDDLNFYNALHLLYIFKLICLQYAKPIVYHLIPKHKFSFTCTILQNETHHRWVYKLCGNIQSQTTPIFPKEQWSMTVWIARTYCQRAPPKLPALNFSLNLVLLI